MEQVRRRWKRLPASLRKSLVLVVGSLFILAAAATGWLPGPGGIPLFLIGIAILATEFTWAERFRDRVLDIVRFVGRQWRQHKIIGTLVFAVCVIVAGICAYTIYRSYN